jgi:hypothetical protein
VDDVSVFVIEPGAFICWGTVRMDVFVRGSEVNSRQVMARELKAENPISGSELKGSVDPPLL